jgi:hypothetical protein
MGTHGFGTSKVRPRAALPTRWYPLSTDAGDVPEDAPFAAVLATTCPAWT